MYTMQDKLWEFNKYILQVSEDIILPYEQLAILINVPYDNNL
jgi:hypothetical protein